MYTPINPLSWVKKSYTSNKFYFDFRKQNNFNLSALDAAYLTIKKITKEYPEPYTLFLSGGVDSQAMLYAWFTSGIKFHTCSVRYSPDFNKQDLISLEQFCLIHNIDIKFVDFNIINFLEREHDFYANEYFCGSPHMTCYMKMIKLFNNRTSGPGTAIMSGNFIDEDVYGYSGYGPNQLSLYNFAIKSGIPFVPFFFAETEELAYSFTSNEYVKTMSKDFKIEIDGGYTRKVLTYQSHGFPVLFQPKKLNGFETVKDWYDTHYTEGITVKDRLAKGLYKTTRNFDIKFRNKYESKFSEMYEIIL